MKYLIINLFVTLLSINCSFAQKTGFADDTVYLTELVIPYVAFKLTPVTFQNIYQREINTKTTGQEPSFILAETPSMTNYSDAGNSQGYSYFRLRGIDQTRINITLDGVPLNEPEDQGAYFSNYPDILNSVSRIQIQRGIGTSKNGVASYAGSVELSSPNLRDSSKTNFGLGYGSFNSFRVFGEYTSGLKKNKALYVRASQVYSDGYKYSSSNNSQSIFLSTGLFQKKSTWKLNLLAGQQRNDMAWLGVSDSLIAVDRRTNANSEQEDDRFIQCLAQLQNTWRISSNSNLQSSVYYTFLTGDYDFDFNNFLGFPPTEELYNYAFQSNLIGAFSNYTWATNNLNWTTGIHGNTYQRVHIGSERSLGELYRNTGFKNEISAFTKPEFEWKKFVLFADLQVRYVNFNYEGSVEMEQLDWTFLNPKAGASFRINSNSSIYYSIGNTGREPTRNDMFGGNDDLLADNLGNPLLFNTEAEYVTDHELGFRHKTYSNKVNIGANLYYMDFQNEIVLDGKFGPNGLALTNNVEQSIRAGAELSVSYRINPFFKVTNNSSFNYSQIKEQSEVFRPILTPAVIVNQEIEYNLNNFRIALSGRYQSSSFIDFANEETVEGYFLLNSRASYRLKAFNFSVFLNNITNTRYFNQAYVDFDGSKKYFVQAPINFHASIQYSF